MAWFFGVLALFMTAQADPCTQPDDCGIYSATIPDYALSDVNPNSPSYGSVISRSDHIGEVMVVYFSAAT